jgi:hypothetical protein
MLDLQIYIHENFILFIFINVYSFNLVKLSLFLIEINKKKLF